MRTIGEVSRLSGVSVRALHHYDAIGLLRPSAVTEAGYRLYDEAALLRLQNILLFRQLGFPLREIGAMLDAPDFDRRAALRDQIALLTLRQAQTEKIIALARTLLQEEEPIMDFSAFDNSAYARYAAEAKERWGKTEAFRQSKARQNARSDAENRQAADGLMAIFARFGALRAGDPAAPAAQALAAELQRYLTAHYYDCTPEILRGLGAMYEADARFAANIDAAGGEGTAAFAARAIERYTR